MLNHNSDKFTRLTSMAQIGWFEVNYDDYDTEYYEECSRRLSKVFKVESLHYEVKDGDSRNWAYINFLTVGKLMMIPHSSPAASSFPLRKTWDWQTRTPC